MAALTSTYLSETHIKLSEVDGKSKTRKSQTTLSFATNKSFLGLKSASGFKHSQIVRAVADEAGTIENAASATGDSVVPEVAALPEAGDTAGVAPKKGVLSVGGTLAGDKKAGKDPSAAALGKSSWYVTADGDFADPRWKDGTWDLSQFTTDGKVDWDAVIDAEVVRRKWLEERPESSTNDAPVLFDTSIVPWWAWVKRFHLPEAEKLNGRAAMIGYALGYVVDAATGSGLVDQQNSFLGKLLIFVSVLGVLFIRELKDIDTIKELAEEWTFYDKQWQATWKEGPPRRGSESEE